MNAFHGMMSSACSPRCSVTCASSVCRPKGWRHATDPTTRRYYDALQATFKILINSFYGYLGFTMGHFNDFEQAERVTRTGREIIQHIIGSLENTGCRIIEVDTDGLYFTPPARVRTLEDEERLLDDVSQKLPTGISLEL